MKATTKFIEELKTKAVDWQTEDDGSGHKGETTYTFYLADIEELLTKHEEDILQKDIERLEELNKKVDVPIGDYGHYSVEIMIESTLQSIIDIKRKELEELNKS